MRTDPRWAHWLAVEGSFGEQRLEQVEAPRVGEGPHGAGVGELARGVGLLVGLGRRVGLGHKVASQSNLSKERLQ